MSSDSGVRTNETPKSCLSPQSPFPLSPRVNARMGTVQRKVQEITTIYTGCLQIWDETIATGTPVVKRLAARKVDLLRQCAACHDESVNPFSAQLQESCDNLTEIVQGLTQIAEKVENLHSQLQHLIQLSEMHRGQGSSDVIKTLSWTMDNIMLCVNTLQEGFTKELRVKRHVMTKIAHSKDEEQIALYISMWELQPYLNDRCRMVLDAMVVEVGLW